MRALLSRTWTRWCFAVVAVALAGCGGGSGNNNNNPPDSGTPVSSNFTLHYHRALADYSGWNVAVSTGANESSASSSSTDGFGAVYALTVKSGATQLSFTLVNGSSTDGAGTVTVDVSGTIREAWVFSGFSTAITKKPSAIPGANQVAVYYIRPDASYSGWALHTWGDVVTETQWTQPLQPVGTDPAPLGEAFLINVKPGATRVNIIVHNGDTKDPGPDMGWDIPSLGNIVFVTSGSANVTARPLAAGEVSINGAAAHLVQPLLVAWDMSDPAATSFELQYSSTASIASSGTNITGGQKITLTPSASGLPPDVRAKAPYLNTGGTWWRAFTVDPADASKVQDALKGQLVAIARKSDGSVFAATQVQTAWAIDALWAYSGPLGVAFDTPNTPTVRLWAPTAQAVKLHVADATKTEIAAVDMTEDATGVWSATGPDTWYGKYYRFELTVYHPSTGNIEHPTVTDPYAVNLDTNGLWAQFIDLSDPATKPPTWDALTKPALAAPEDIVVYEGHIRDFSALDSTVSAANRGKYLAFTETSSNGMQHLATLAGAGITHFHLMPAFDFATVNEDPAQRVDIGQPFSDLCAKNSAVPAATCTQFGSTTILDAYQSYPGDSDQQQLIASYLYGLDSFNWGYDPFHYGAPEGSYASTAEGTAKILEFRQMVQGLAGIGLRVVMDVVYNHTNAAGLGDKSVLDKIVPGYYHRLDPTTGFVLNSSCCANTASEHVMMEKLMIDTLERWARDYRIDGFRFDLMGLHLKDNMIHVRDALQAIDPTIYLYGEGWEIGEMTNGGRGVAAIQLNMGGTGIGTFNDRLRDGARGGGPFDSGKDLRKNQGFSSGLYTDPNELSSATQANQDALAHALDLIKIGMAGGLGSFRMVSSTSQTPIPASGIGYGGKSAGYTQDPSETINYVSSHDNQILWDIVQYKLPTGRTMDDRVRAVAQAMDVVLLGQGVRFFHMGDDMLRSKSMEHDSYDSGDWFNRIDWTGTSNGWRSGLPNAGKDSGNWPTIRPIFADTSIAPAAADITKMGTHFQAMLALRKASPLFRLRSAADVMARVDFPDPYSGPNQVPALLVMTISDAACAGGDLDPTRSGLVVIVNAGVTAQDVTVPGTSGGTFSIPTALSTDPLLPANQATWNGTVFHVKPRTTAVFERPQGEAAGLPCNTR
jgi:pullulanase-type alpha-1,6-glucosidase